MYSLDIFELVININHQHLVKEIPELMSESYKTQKKNLFKVIKSIIKTNEYKGLSVLQGGQSFLIHTASTGAPNF